MIRKINRKRSETLALSSFIGHFHNTFQCPHPTSSRGQVLSSCTFAVSNSWNLQKRNWHFFCLELLNFVKDQLYSSKSILLRETKKVMWLKFNYMLKLLGFFLVNMEQFRPNESQENYQQTPLQAVRKALKHDNSKYNNYYK